MTGLEPDVNSALRRRESLRAAAALLSWQTRANVVTFGTLFGLVVMTENKSAHHHANINNTQVD